MQYWRLLTTFIYFGPLSLNLLFHIFFIQRYARMLEESAASVAHFSYLMAYATTTLLAIAPLSNQAFLGTTLSSTLVYIWSRRNPDVRLSFLGLLTFKAPWLPWVLIAFNVVLHGHWPKDELCGIVVGHGEYTNTELEAPRGRHAIRWMREWLTTHSVVLLQRHLPLHTRRPPTTRAAAVVDQHVRARSLGRARGLGRACHGAQSRCCGAGGAGTSDSIRFAKQTNR